MKTLFVPFSEDPARTLEAALRPFGSLQCTRRETGALLHALGVDAGYATPKDPQTLPEAAAAITGRGEAEWSIFRRGIDFLTPGGVLITVTPGGIQLDFGRDSTFLSSSVIASVAMADGRPFVARFL